MSELTPDQDAKYQAAFRTCRDEIKHEYGVLANRLNSYITSQAFLVSGYAISMGNMNPTWGNQYRLLFPLLLSVLGVVLTIRAHPGIAGVCQVIQHWHVKQKDLFKTGAKLDDYSVLKHDSVKKIHDSNLLFAQTSTWIFGSAWILMAGLAIYLRFF
jgi:hypothetical protein